jgi:hypothetical protein
MNRKVLLCTGVSMLVLALACNKSSAPTTSPSSTAAAKADATSNPDGTVLKVTAPGVVSPTGGGQVTDPIVLTATPSAGKNAAVSLSYLFQVRQDTTVVYESPLVAGGGTEISHAVPSNALQTDTDYTWRVRPVLQNETGPWSADGAFRSPVGAFIRGNQVRDPLTIGSSVGEIRGPVQFIPGQGLKLVGPESHVLYRLPQNLQDGEISMMILGADEGSPGDKSKVFAAKEGPNEGDITDGDYRLTIELRGRNYGAPGSVTCRIKPRDDVPRDCPRVQINFNSSRWYFWRFAYNLGLAVLTVRLDGENGPIVYQQQVSMHGSPYRPDPMYVYLGAPSGRAGLQDATLPGGIYKNVYVGPSPRPAFPQ